MPMKPSRPQIAARADQHLVVSKEARGGLATSDVQVIHGEDRVNELARMLGDTGGDAARRHAQAMLRKDGRTGERALFLVGARKYHLRTHSNGVPPESMLMAVSVFVRQLKGFGPTHA